MSRRSASRALERFSAVHIAIPQPFLSRSWAKMVKIWVFVAVTCCCEKAAGQLCSCIKCVRNPVCTVPRTGGGPLDFVLTFTVARTLCTHANVLNARAPRKSQVFVAKAAKAAVQPALQFNSASKHPSHRYDTRGGLRHVVRTIGPIREE